MCTNAPRVPRSAKDSQAACTPSTSEAGTLPTRCAIWCTVRRIQRGVSDAADRSTSSVPGRLAARSASARSWPSPPLETSTTRSTYSGNWCANCIATPPPNECPTIVTRSMPRATSRSRRPVANPPSEQSPLRGASLEP
ncbi:MULTISPECIES: hypothetical protein [unclassified Pseudonocardia]|uniref:hypothetical protein n=1 Tax=Pseudonocardia sp. Ae150A_Ps1 TaxID=1885028 RepID=UPI001BAE5F0B|nr:MULTISPECIES: hypothetical protein [unclassified Pseudonocardia]